MIFNHVAPLKIPNATALVIQWVRDNFVHKVSVTSHETRLKFG